MTDPEFRAANREARRARRQAGWTLIEMLVVITILAVLGGYVGLRYIRYVDNARVTTAQNQIRTFKDALLMYRNETGKFPTTEEGLAALRSHMNGDIPLDPWGHSYVYRFPGEHGEEPDIVSYGADGQPGGTGIDADIVSWKTQQ